MNWGKGLVIWMAVFVIFILVLGIKMIKVAPDDFDPKYYEKGLAFDSTYAKEKRVFTDKAEPVIKILADSVEFTFVEPSNGVARFQRPDDKGMDRALPFRTGQANAVSIAQNRFEKGRWDLTLDWQSQGKKYMLRRSLFLQ